MKDNEDSDEGLSNATKEVGFSFIIALLNEMKKIGNASILESSLQQFLQILKR